MHHWRLEEVSCSPAGSSAHMVNVSTLTEKHFSSQVWVGGIKHTSVCTEKIYKELKKTWRIEYRWCCEFKQCRLRKRQSLCGMSLSTRNNLRNWLNHGKKPSQEPQTVPQHTHLHHLESSPSFKAFTRISFPSSHSKKLKPEECAHRQHLTP